MGINNTPAEMRCAYAASCLSRASTSFAESVPGKCGLRIHDECAADQGARRTKHPLLRAHPLSPLWYSIRFRRSAFKAQLKEFVNRNRRAMHAGSLLKRWPRPFCQGVPLSFRHPVG